ncbi:ABC transporter ATP-binding protein [Nakamurella sp. PAMC28650]|nr:ABC transporter ATP-binding protein [Nakamurella sp. PAMC28650]
MLLSVTGLTVKHAARKGDRTILSGVDLTVGTGETIGIVGESGSGKSMLAKAVMRLLPRDVHANGQVYFDGQDVLAASDRQAGALRGGQMTLLYQDPFTMLNPLLSAGGHVVEALRAGRGREFRPSRREAVIDAQRRMTEVGIADSDVLHRYPFQLSGGMRQRVALATALARDPRLLVADEPSTALDVTTQAEILALLKSVQRARSMGLVLITHDLRVAFSVCDRIYVLYAGSLMEVGKAQDLERQPLHPYTQGLLLSEPAVDRKLAVMAAIGGSVPAPDDVAGQCVFAPRCEFVRDVCVAGTPLLREIGGRLSACVRTDEISSELAARRAVSGATAAPADASAQIAPLLTVKDLVKVFSGHRGRHTRALDGVSITVGRNESVGLVGESGSGKTTIGRCVVGLETPTSGAISLNGLAANDYSKVTAGVRRELRKTAQIIFQDPYSSLDPKQSVGSALLETLRVNGAGRDMARQRVGELLADVGLPADYGSRMPAALSGGERQRVAIARALAVDPALIVCDEPVSALDVSVQAQILTLLQDIRGRTGVSYLFITHDLAVVRQVADRVYVLHRGAIVEQGKVDDVMDRPKHDYTRRLLDSIPTSATFSDRSVTQPAATPPPATTPPIEDVIDR